MKKNILINPIAPKGNEINERIKNLMGLMSVNETGPKISVEITKKGADGKAYAIVRENQEWFIKVADKTKNLIAEDFKYIGGLQNKKDEAYPSYSKALKQLALKLKSIAEAYDYEGDINIYRNDNLLNENNPMVGGFSQIKGNGFSGEGNLEGNKPMDEAEKSENSNPWAICAARVGRKDKKKYEDCVMAVKKQYGIKEEEIELSEAEKAIDEMLAKYNHLEEKLDPVGSEDNDIDNDGDTDSTDKYLKHRRDVISKNIKQPSKVKKVFSELSKKYPSIKEELSIVYTALVNESEENNSDTTEMIFRKYEDGEIIALFPKVIENRAKNLVKAYVHNGQHVQADLRGTIESTVPATEEEYADLFSELKSIGYKIKVLGLNENLNSSKKKIH
jgi:hypothetical protein